MCFLMESTVMSSCCLSTSSTDALMQNEKLLGRSFTENHACLLAAITSALEGSFLGSALLKASTHFLASSSFRDDRTWDGAI